MSKPVTVSFKMEADQYTVLRAMATRTDLCLSAFLRQTVEQALELDRQLERLAAFLAEAEGARCSQG